MPTTTYASPPSSPLSAHKPSAQPLTRNIDQVLLGSVLFDTWYYSPYPDSIISSADQRTKRANTTTTATTQGFGPSHGAKSANNAVNVEHDVSTNASRGQTTCSRLHVCPRCFAYTPNAQHYVTHLKHHCPLSGSSEPLSDRRGISPALSTENVRLAGIPPSATRVYDHDGYTVWEVDGDLEKLYCQNLSLFGKLFLEQKSVFFDVGGFMYYVLTYTPPAGTSLQESERDGKSTKPKKTPSPTTVRVNKKRKQLDSSTLVSANAEDWIQTIHTETQTLGFFSKEKLSWDSNNLACIVIFPPYQHRSLGKLLMSVSYKLSGWEWEGGVIGGPEKPLSAMGKKSYTRFWEERVARYLLGETRDADGRRILQRANAARKKGKKKLVKMKKKEGLTVKEIGDRTGMLAEDVVVALVEMGIAEPVGRKGGKKLSPKKSTAVNGEVNKHAQPVVSTADVGIANMIVKRSKVLDWVEKHGIDIKDQVAEEGFLGEWALSDDDIVMEGDDDSEDEVQSE